MRSFEADLSLVPLVPSPSRGAGVGGLCPLLPASLPSAMAKAQVRLQTAHASPRTPFQMPEGCTMVPYCAVMPPLEQEAHAPASFL